MFVKENTLSAIRDYFFDSLSGMYPKEEIHSFYHILCEHFLGFSKADLLLSSNKNLSESELLKFHFALKDLVNNKPVQYITGSQFFYNHEFRVNEYTLIPRPETEELVDLIVKDNPKFNGNILDIGTGSGAIAISLDKALPQSRVIGFDISEKTLETAKENNISIEGKVEFIHQDILNPTYFEDIFDIVVSNPPYVLDSEKKQMKNNVLNYEPHIALFVNDSNPLIFYQAIVDFCKEYLNKNGLLYFEINEQYGKQTIDLLEENGYLKIELIQDMQGKDRIIKGIKA